MTKQQPPLIAHVIFALGMGGMENGLVNIINRAPTGQYRHAIICLTQAHDFAARLTAPGVEIIALHKREGHDLGVYWRFYKVLRRLRPAILHTRNLAALEMQLVRLLVPGIKGVHGEHGRDIYDLDGSNKKYRLLRRLLRPFVHRYIAVSKDLAQWLVASVGVRPERVRQIYNGVDPVEFRPRQGVRPGLLPVGFLPQQGLLVGTVGRLAEVKDHRTLIRAMRLLIEREPALRDRVRFCIVGSGPLLARLNDLARELEISDLLWMPGDREDVADLLREMDIFVLPSLAEGISNTLLEAMATGLPLIATRTGGNPELIDDGDNGLLFPVADAEGLAGAMAALIADGTRRKTMGERSRRKVDEQFNWGRTVEAYLSVYDSVLSVGRGQG